MSNSPNNVLVFGAAGAVGRAAAISASKRGAKVWLAMRNTSKIIPGLSEADERDAGFVRIQADLSDPSSLKAAVAKSNAKSAFVYALFDSSDYMRNAFDTLKESGITYIVLLSSYSVSPSAEEAKNYSFIPQLHARVEIQLFESGVKYAALRPAYFNSNVLWHVEGIKKGEVAMFGSESHSDFIAPEDIGAVAATLLTTPSSRLPENEKNGKSIYLCGPKVMSIKDAFGIISQVLGKDITVKEIDEETFLDQMNHMPRAVVDSIVELTKKNIPPGTEYNEEFWVPAVKNIKKYAEREPTTFADWIEAHRNEFA